MTKVSYNPFRPARVKTFDHFLDEIVGTTFSEIIGSTFVSATPSVNIVESDTDYSIEVAAPGLAKGDFDVVVEDEELIVTGKKEEVNAVDTEKGKYTRREFNYQSFSRRFHLSDDLDKESISAIYANGILTVKISKKEDSSAVNRTIEIG